jgi:hypothetical protein
MLFKYTFGAVNQHTKAFRMSSISYPHNVQKLKTFLASFSFYFEPIFTPIQKAIKKKKVYSLFRKPFLSTQ